jgi:hypothetical protein
MTASLPLHAALRRVIATNDDPGAAAHRAVGVFARWLRERARQQERERDRRIDPLAHVKVVGASWLADEIDAGTATAAEADAEIARLREQVESARADERQRCVDYLRAEAARMDAEAAVPGEPRALLLGEDAASLSVAASLLTVRMHGLAQGPAENGGSKEMAGD